MKRYLITGGAGFIGSHIVEELLRRGYFVRVLDNLSTGKIKNISEFMNKIEFVKGDIRDFSLLKKVTKGVDFIFHQAALPSVPRSVKDPLTTNDVNIQGSLNVFYAAKENKVKRVVYASSSSIYGNIKIKKFSSKKEFQIPFPLSPYAVSKLTPEYYASVFYKVYGLETVCLRYFNVFGPKQNPDSQYAAVIPKFIKIMLKNKRPPIYGDGTQTRDFTFVKNVVIANLLAMSKKKAKGRIFNIACGRRYSVKFLVDSLNRIMHKDILPLYCKEREADVKHSLANINLAKKILGYTSQISFYEGLKITVNWYKKNLKDK